MLNNNKNNREENDIYIYIYKVHRKYICECFKMLIYII